MLNINGLPGSFENIANTEHSHEFVQYINNSIRMEINSAAFAAETAANENASPEDIRITADVAARVAQTERENRAKHWNIENGFPE